LFLTVSTEKLRKYKMLKGIKNEEDVIIVIDNLKTLQLRWISPERFVTLNY